VTPGAPVAAKPFLVIDVDGVLNPYHAPPGVVPPGFTEHTIKGYRVLLRPQDGPALAAFADRFELVWATTWEDDANRLLAPILGMPKLPVVHFEDPTWRTDWKIPAVAAFVGDRPLAWIDDDFREDADGWAKGRPAPTLLVRPDPAVGLLSRHFRALDRFAAQLAARNAG
jgi:hypothetical protein